MNAIDAKNIKKSRFFLITCLFLLSITRSMADVSASTDLSLSMHRDFGIGLGRTHLSGILSARCSGGDEIVNLTLYFNDQFVAFAEGNELIFKFNTKNYESGYVEVKLVGYDSTGQSYEKTIQVTFLSNEVSVCIIIGTIVVIIVFLLFKYTNIGRKSKRDKNE